LLFGGRQSAIQQLSVLWWISLSTAIVFGLGSATLLTLIVMPAALMAIEQLAGRRRRWAAALRARFA
jgi:multidrug efflux pump